MKSRRIGRFHAIKMTKNITHAPMIVFVSTSAKQSLAVSIFPASSEPFWFISLRLRGRYHSLLTERVGDCVCSRSKGMPNGFGGV